MLGVVEVAADMMVDITVVGGVNRVVVVTSRCCCHYSGCYQGLKPKVLVVADV